MPSFGNAILSISTVQTKFLSRKMHPSYFLIGLML